MMDMRDYMAEHKRLMKVLKAAKTPAAARELRLQKAEVKMAKIPAGMHRMPDGKLMKDSAHRGGMMEDSDMMRRR